jgi:hypothetical protein
MRIRESFVGTKGKPANLRPKIGKWKGVPFIRNHSFLSTISTICKFSMKRDVVKIGIIGLEGTGKSTMAAAIGHAIHKIMKDKYKINFAVKIFYEEDLLDFKVTLSKLEPTNYVLIFDDVSFMEGSANKMQITAVKQAITKIRHLQGGQDVKIILINNYHYTLGLDKYLRQSDFKYFTTVGSSELENMEKIVKSENMRKVHQFVRFIDEGLKKDFWRWPLSPKEFFKYDWQDPFIPALFYDNIAIRHIISPRREFIDPICSICANAIGIRHSEVPIKEFIADGVSKFGASVFKAAIKLKLFENGLNTYGRTYTQAKRFLDTSLTNHIISFEDLMVEYGLKLTKTRVDKQYLKLIADDEKLKEKDDNDKIKEGLH